MPYGNMRNNSDIGCGMLACRTDLKGLSKEVLEDIVAGIKQRVPVGKNWHSVPKSEDILPKGDPTGIVLSNLDKASLQLGTLGGGNHFIELQTDEAGYVWVMIHSGSRNLGKQVADYWGEIANDLCTKWGYNDIVKNELAFLPRGIVEFDRYLADMQYCVDFALINRQVMLTSITDVLVERSGQGYVKFEPQINIAHNYAAIEHHFGTNVVVHRKGATLARKGTVGIIPGSQGTNSYIVEGRGNPESFNSCSHGAGRIMSRAKARKNLSLEDEQKLLNDQGIVHGITSINDLDEAPSAYKNIDEVMENQKDLVNILHELRPIAVIKG